jgi:hypothetical protein
MRGRTNSHSKRYLSFIFSLLIAVPVLADTYDGEPRQRQESEAAKTEDEKMKKLIESEHMKARQRREQEMKKASDKVE